MHQIQTLADVEDIAASEYDSLPHGLAIRNIKQAAREERDRAEGLKRMLNQHRERDERYVDDIGKALKAAAEYEAAADALAAQR